MKFFEGEIQNAITRRRSFCSAFIVFVEDKNLESQRFGQLLEDENFIPAKEYIAFRISPLSVSYKHFVTIYGETPIPSLVIIGLNGQPIRIISTCEPKDEFYANIKQALDIHKAELVASRRLDRSQNEIVQILLKLPKGETAAVEFSENSNLGEVKAFVKESLQVKGPFQMITPFPRKIFSNDDEGKSLVELQLNPTSTILIIPIDKYKSWIPQFARVFIRALMTKVFRVLRAVKDFFAVLVPTSRT